MDSEKMVRYGGWMCLATVVAGMVIGLAGVWLDGVVPGDLVGKLAVTDGILFVGSLLMTVLSWLWMRMRP